VVPTGRKVRFTNTKARANLHRNTAGTRTTDRNSGTSRFESPMKRPTGALSINRTAGMPPANCAKREGPTRDRAMYGKTSGNASVHAIGDVSIAPGTNAAATTDIVFRKIGSVRILAGDTGFASMKFRS